LQITNQPCWRIAVNVLNMDGSLQCPNGDHFTLKVERTEAPAPETHVVSYCVTEAI
jgi:hypothetical protein